MTLVLTRKIKQAIARDGFLLAIVYGVQGVGKSSYSIHVAREVYGDWQQALQNTVFLLKDFVQKLRHAYFKGYKYSVLIWDDAGVHANKYVYYTNIRLVEQLKQIIDVIRTVVKALIVTTPAPDALLKTIREYEYYSVKVVFDTGDYRKAIIYKNSLLPNGYRYAKKQAIDRFKVKLPDDVYDVYSRMRAKYLEHVLNNINY